MIEDEQIGAFTIPISRHHPIPRFGLNGEISDGAKSFCRIGPSVPIKWDLQKVAAIRVDGPTWMLIGVRTLVNVGKDPVGIQVGTAECIDLKSSRRSRALIRIIHDAVSILVPLVCRATKFIDYRTDNCAIAPIIHVGNHVSIVITVFIKVAASVHVEIGLVRPLPADHALRTIIVDVQGSIVVVIRVIGQVMTTITIVI